MKAHPNLRNVFAGTASLVLSAMNPGFCAGDSASAAFEVSFLIPSSSAGAGPEARFAWNIQETLTRDTSDPATQEITNLITPGDQVAALIQALSEDASAEARRSAAEALGVFGSPVAIEALRRALRDDPDPAVRAASAVSLGRGGSMAQVAIPDLIRALDRTGTDGSVCRSAAEALGSLGRLAASAIQPLANAAISGCGVGAEEPLHSLTAIASDVSAHASGQSSAELEEILRKLESAQETLGLRLPSGVLDGLEEALRSRSPNWLSEGAGLIALLVGTMASAFQSVAGVLAAILAVVLVVFGIRYAGRFLSTRAARPEHRRGFAWEWADVEVWLKRPEGRFPRVALTPSRVSRFLEERAESKGMSLPDAEFLEDQWEQFAGTAGGGKVPSFAASAWMDSVMADTEKGEKPSPPGSVVDVLLGEVDARYVPDPGAPPKEMVHRIVQAVAWRTMKEGAFSGSVHMDDLNAGAPGELVEIVLDYADEEMDVLNWDRRRKCVELPVDEEKTARLGGMHLLKHEASSGVDVLRQLDTLQAAAIRSVGRAQAPAFMRTVACALLDAAAGLEDGEGPDLGVAEEALIELADVIPRPGQAAADEEPPPGVFEEERQSPRTMAGKVDRLLQRLQAETHPGVRERVIRALGDLGPGARPALPALMKSVEKDPAGVAVAAVEAVGNLGPAAGEAAPLLISTLETGSPEAKMAAARALGRLGEAGAEATPVLLEWTSKEGISHELRARAAEALGSISSEAHRSIPTLTELLRSGVAQEVRAAAALALARLDPGSKNIEDALRSATKSQDPVLRGMAGIALLVREQRLTGTPSPGVGWRDKGWPIPLVLSTTILAVFQFAAVIGSQILNPGMILPALVMTPALALLAGVGYGVGTHTRPGHPSLGGGLVGSLGSSAGIFAGFLVAPGLTPAALLVGGTMGLGSGALGGGLVRTALLRR